jgi:hypothetical protein
MHQRSWHNYKCRSADYVTDSGSRDMTFYEDLLIVSLQSTLLSLEQDALEKKWCMVTLLVAIWCMWSINIVWSFRWTWLDCIVIICVTVVENNFKLFIYFSFFLKLVWFGLWRRSVLFVEEIEVPRENHRPVASHWQTLSHNVVSNAPRH